MKMKTNMQHNFALTPSINIGRSTFNRSHNHKLTMNEGDLIPFYTDDVQPGDTFNLNAAAMGRIATPLFPFMDNVYIDTHFFFVPSRLVWNKFEEFHGEQLDPGDSIDFLIPKVTTPGGGFAEGTIYDHFGIPTKIATLSPINNMMGRSYNLIWNEWFRDENLQDSASTVKTNGPDTASDFPVRKRGKRHDYLTSCLPSPQKGSAVALPLGTSADITTDAASANDLTVKNTNAPAQFSRMDATFTYLKATLDSGVEADKLYADLSTATAATVNDLRIAFATQRLLEKDARGGTRYTEIIKSHFGVSTSDARVQRPEYLGGGSSPLQIVQVPQTSSTDPLVSPQGNVAAFGTFGFSGHTFNKSFTEHGVIIGLISIRADLNYQQGLDRFFSKQSRLDYYFPELAHIGEQAVLNKEIFADGSANDELVFGYTPRYDEYRHKMSIISGEFRSNATLSLDVWHLAQEFLSLPVLDDAFIQENPPISRVIAVTTNDHFIIDTHITLKCARPMPLNGIPGHALHF